MPTPLHAPNRASSAFAGALLTLATLAPNSPAHADELTLQQKAELQKDEAIQQGLHPQTGDIHLPGAGLTLHLGAEYDYLDPADAKRVLTEVWGNPPEAAAGVLGMVLPAGAKVYEHTWGAVITAEPSGYVSDKDAKSTDYNKFVDQVHEAENKSNAELTKQGYPTQHLVGWAQSPSYDAANHVLIWARDIRFSNQNYDTLNYDIRMLGRRGVVSLNMVAAMPDLPRIRMAAQSLGQRADFDPGSRYADYAAGDRKATYGIAGLVAAGLGLVAAKKFGLLALVALFGKKLFVIIAAAGAAVASRFRKLFGLKPKAAAAPEAPGPDSGSS